MHGSTHVSFRACFALCFLDLPVCSSSSRVCSHLVFAGLEASSLLRIIVTFVVRTVLLRCLIYLLELVCLVCLWELVTDEAVLADKDEIETNNVPR